MSPEDADENILLNFEPSNKTAHAGVVCAGLVDGTVKSLSINIDPDVGRAMMTVSGNESFNESDF